LRELGSHDSPSGSIAGRHSCGTTDRQTPGRAGVAKRAGQLDPVWPSTARFLTSFIMLLFGAIHRIRYRQYFWSSRIADDDTFIAPAEIHDIVSSL